jgi:hypothetical protein
MPLNKPTGFDNFRVHKFTLKTDSGFEDRFILCSFAIDDAGKTKIYRGANITSSTAAAETVITTAEPHKLAPGDIVYIVDHARTSSGASSSVRNGQKTVLATPSTTTFTLAVNTITEGAGTGGIVGVAQDDYVVTAGISALSVDPYTRQERANNEAERLFEADEYFG